MKTVIFDFGNVIIKWNPFAALNGIFDSRDAMDTSLADIGFFDWNLEQDRGRTWPDGIAVAMRDMPENAHIFRAYAENLGAAHSDLVPGTSELIRRLNADGIGLVGLTNASLKTVDLVRQTAPVLDLMQDIVISAEVNLLKPDPAIFHLCLERSRLDPQETLFVDDSLANCATARDVGMHAHHFTDAKGLGIALNDLDFL